MSVNKALARLGAELGPEQVQLDGAWLSALPASAEEVAFAVRVADEESLFLCIGNRSASAAPSRRAKGARSGVLRIDPARLSALLHIDESSLLVHAQAGMRLDALAVRLSAVGMTLGALPAASLSRTLGALMSAPRPSEATPRGRLVDLCAAASAVLPDGTTITTHLSPRKATGPDFLHALIGAHGEHGLFTSLWLRAARRPPRRLFAGYAIKGEAQALAIARTLLDRGCRPAELVVADLVSDRVAQDVDDTGFSDGMQSGEVVLALHFDGTPETLAAEAAMTESLVHALAENGAARTLSPPLVEAWLLREPPFAVAREEMVAMSDLARAFAARTGPTILSGFRPAGAALRSATPRSASAPATPAFPSLVTTLRAALRRRLDPAGLILSRPPPEDEQGAQGDS